MKKLNETKLIIQNWRMFLNENESTIDEPTIGDLKAFLKGDIKKMKAKKFIKIVAKISGGAVIGDIIGGATNISDFMTSIGSESVETAISSNKISDKVKDLGSKLKDSNILKRFYGLNGQGGYPGFKINPDTSKILDDKVEEEFIKWLYEDIQNLEDNIKLSDFNCDEKFNEFLKKKKGNIKINKIN
jgi:hypothetical protein